jgi:hypothetical protein
MGCKVTKKRGQNKKNSFFFYAEREELIQSYEKARAEQKEIFLFLCRA